MQKPLFVKLDETLHTEIKIECVKHGISLRHFVEKCFLENLGRIPFEPIHPYEGSEIYEEDY